MLILVRHGRTAYNADGRLQGRADIALDDVGKQQANAIAQFLGSVDRVITSPLQRATETASYLKSAASPVVDDRWIELDYGDFDGLSLSEISRDIWRQWRTDPSFAPPGGENLESLRDRVFNACDELIDSIATENVAVVSHVSPVKAAVTWALGLDSETAWRTHLDVASVSRISQREGVPLLISFNETSHLS